MVALRSVRGYELDGDITQGHQRMRVRLLSDARNALDVAIVINNSDFQVLRLPSGLYMRANAAFWRSHLGARGNVLADRWIQTPVSDGALLLSGLRQFEPAFLARCLAENNGSLSLDGTTTIDGQPAVVIRDAGNLPGTQPSTLAVAASGSPYPLRATATGAGRPGGHIDVCNDGKANNYRGSITLSNFDHVSPLVAPTDVLRIASAPTT